MTCLRHSGINRGESGLASNHFLMCTPQLDRSEMFTELYRGMVWGGRREEGSGWGTHVYLWQIHFDIWQN